MNRRRRDSTVSRGTSMTLAWAGRTWSRFSPSFSFCRRRAVFRRGDLTPVREREETFRALRQWLKACSDRQPVLFVIEDLHWIDASTLEFLGQFIAEGLHDRILTVLTFRPEFTTPWPAVAGPDQPRAQSPDAAPGGRIHAQKRRAPFRIRWSHKSINAPAECLYWSRNLLALFANRWRRTRHSLHSARARAGPTGSHVEQSRGGSIGRHAWDANFSTTFLPRRRGSEPQTLLAELEKLVQRGDSLRQRSAAELHLRFSSTPFWRRRSTTRCLGMSRSGFTARWRGDGSTLSEWRKDSPSCWPSISPRLVIVEKAVELLAQGGGAMPRYGLPMSRRSPT